MLFLCHQGWRRKGSLFQLGWQTGASLVVRLCFYQHTFYSSWWWFYSVGQMDTAAFVCISRPNYQCLAEGSTRKLIWKYRRDYLILVQIPRHQLRLHQQKLGAAHRLPVHRTLAPSSDSATAWFAVLVLLISSRIGDKCKFLSYYELSSLISCLHVPW